MARGEGYVGTDVQSEDDMKCVHGCVMWKRYSGGSGKPSTRQIRRVVGVGCHPGARMTSLGESTAAREVQRIQKKPAH
ncbi:hypothetical protein Aduo_012699 [Ancylostoma duodenale]